MAGPVRLARLPLLLVMPAVAVAVYAMGVVLAVPVEVIYSITAVGGVMGTAVLGALVFLAALVWTIRGNRPRS